MLYGKHLKKSKKGKKLSSINNNFRDEIFSSQKKTKNSDSKKARERGCEKRAITTIQEPQQLKKNLKQSYVNDWYSVGSRIMEIISGYIVKEIRPAVGRNDQSLLAKIR